MWVLRLWSAYCKYVPKMWSVFLPFVRHVLSMCSSCSYHMVNMFFACVQQVLSICSKCSLNMLSMFLCLLLMLKMFNAYAHHVHRIFLACTWNHAWHVFNMYSVYTNIFKALHREVHKNRYAHFILHALLFSPKLPE